MSKTSDKKSKKYDVTNVTYKVEQAEEVQMAASNGIPISKTLDSIASLPKDEKLAENVELDFKRSGVLLMANSDAEGGNGDLLFSGNLSLMKKTQFNIPTIEWIPQSDHNSGDEQANGMCKYYNLYIRNLFQPFHHLLVCYFLIFLHKSNFYLYYQYLGHHHGCYGCFSTRNFEGKCYFMNSIYIH